MILTFTPNPCVDKTLFYESVELGQRLRSERCTCIPGGKGTNVSRAVKALGFKSAAAVIVGGPPGQHVVNMIRNQDDVDCQPYWVDGMTRTITTVLEETAHRQTAFFEPGPIVTEEEKQSILASYKNDVVSARVATFNGTVPDRTLEDLYASLIQAAKNAGAMTILDAHGPEFLEGLKAQPTMVKPNVEEAEKALGKELKSEADQIDALKHFHDQGVELAVMSLGEKGALVSRDGVVLRVTPPDIKEVNPVGSGDAVVAGFAVGLLEGWTLEETARLAVAAGTANAMSWDIGHFTKEEVGFVGEDVIVEVV